MFTIHSFAADVIQWMFAQLPEEIMSGQFGFVDRNGWPITAAQESDLVVIDLMRDGGVRIRLPAVASLSHSQDGDSDVDSFTRAAIAAEVKRGLTAALRSKARFNRFEF